MSASDPPRPNDRSVEGVRTVGDEIPGGGVRDDVIIGTLICKEDEPAVDLLGLYDLQAPEQVVQLIRPEPVHDGTGRGGDHGHLPVAVVPGIE